MSKSYTLFLNIQNAINYTNLQPGQGTCDVQFYVDWGAILPSDCEKCEVTTVLKSITSTVAFSATTILILNFGSGNSYNQANSEESISLILNPDSYKTATSRNFFGSLKNNKGICQINRPTDNYLRVRLFDITRVIATGFPAFTLRLKFTPVK